MLADPRKLFFVRLSCTPDFIYPTPMFPRGRVLSMYGCRTCLWRCIRALDASSPRNVRLLQTSSRTIPSVPTRSAELASVQEAARSKDEPWKRSTQAASLRRRERQSMTRHPIAASESASVESGTTRKLGRRDPSVSTSDFHRRKKELQYLSDPLELATFVRKELSKDKVTEMLQLVRIASHSMQCIVSWNHIIDYYLARQRVSQAFKVYNDMKKRAQFPDSYTYTILLRGLAANAHESGAHGKALSVYHSMSAPNSRVQPSIIHTNAMLKVCARAMDMDALWGVAAKIPESGPASANGRTYVTILNAIRQSLLVNVPAGETEEQVAVRRESGVVEGRRVWQDIITRWRKADLVIEEEMVCAMGRLLLIGARPRDWDDVLSLVEQTMDIPRLVPRLGSVARKEAGLPQIRAPNVPEQFRFEDTHLDPSGGSVRGAEFLPIEDHGIGGAVSGHLTYAKPSNNTLSMVQEACQKVVAVKASEEYWNLMTDPTTYAIVPDTDNLHFRLRLLRQNRASASAVQLLQDEFVAKGIEPRPATFRIAMSTCVKDKNNHNSLKHGGQILNAMTKTLEDVDAIVATMYAELAITFPLAKGPDLVDALARLDYVVRNIRLQLGVGAESKANNGVGTRRLVGPARHDAINALRRVQGVFDRLIQSDMVPEEQKRPYKAEKARLTAFLHRVAFNDGEKGLFKRDGERGPVKEPLRDGDADGAKGVVRKEVRA